MDGPGNPDTYTTDDNWRRVQAASDSHLPPEGTDRWQHEGIDLVEITASDERFMTAMSYPRHETTDRTVEPKTKGAGGQHLETDAALEPVIKLIEPKAYKGDDPGPQEIYPGFKTGQSRSVIRTHGAPSPWIHGETILGPQDPLRFVLIKSHKKQNKGVIEEAGQVPWKLKTKVFPPRVMEVEDNPASGQDGIDSTARSLVTSPVQKFNPQADQKTTHQAPNPRGRGVSALPVVDEEPTEVTTKPALEKVRGKRPKSKVRFSDGSPSGVPKPTDETPLEPDKKQDEPISKHRRRPQKPNESLLQAALHNAARAKEKAAAGSNSSAASSSVFSPEVYMENMWEAATTQATRDDRKEIMGLSLTRWLERDSHLLESVCRTGKPQVVRHLLSKGVNPGTRKKPRPTPLLLAVQGGTPQHYKCVQALLHRGVDLNVKHKRSGKTALHLAIETADFKGHTNLVRDLAAGGANPNIPDRTGELPIHAIFRGGEPSGPLKKHRLDALACILKVDICGETDVNVSEPHERHSPLHLAVAKTSPYAVGMLLYKGANVNAENAIRVTPLLLAATQWAGGPLTPDQEVVLDLLLKAPGIEVDRQAGGSGRTALHFAALHCAPAAVRLLLAKSASARGTDSKGMTPLELCATNDTSKWKVERDEIRALLR
ncbi:ankyrin repeat-containing domain protein [Aspergillus keveii]|uniref:Ankyrin repeat-containing domain protein n=1 Tax=Aspergillus keveii TaxID=714993 RepID=A0ABR4FV63_9EURO